MTIGCGVKEKKRQKTKSHKRDNVIDIRVCILREVLSIRGHVNEMMKH
jgi:hypothetical protein